MIIIKKLWVLITLFIFPMVVSAGVSNATDKEIVTIYSLIDDSEESKLAKEWLDNYYKKYAYVKIEYLDDSSFKEVKEALNIKKDYKPVIILGSTYFYHFNDEVKEELVKAINAYQEHEHCNIMENLDDAKSCLKQNKDIYESPFKEKSYLVFYIIGGVVIIGLISTFLGLKKLKRK